MWKDVLVQLARHAALRRALLVDGEVKILPATGRQTKCKDWRLGEGKMICVIDTLVRDELRPPSFGFRAHLKPGTKEPRVQENGRIEFKEPCGRQPA